MSTEITPPAEPEVPVVETDQVTISAAEFKALEEARSRLVAIEDEKKQTATALEAMTTKSVADLAAANARAEEATARASRFALDSQLAQAFGGHDLYEGSAEDLSELWRKDFEVTPDGERFQVRAKDGRTVSAVVAERLAQPRYSNHVRATSRHGAGGGAGNMPAPTQGISQQQAPMSVSDALLIRERDRLTNAKPTRGLAYRP